MLKNVKFIKSAAAKSDWINDDIPEVCFIGRSNVGKSSFINSLTNNKSMAKTSSTPGKTRFLNFFEVDSKWRIVDAPGYGYARVSFSQKEAFGKLMEDYLTTRPNLKFVCQLVDLRHKPTVDDIDMYNFFKYHNLKVWIVATKLDKVKKNDIKKNEIIIKKELNFNENDNFFIVSNFDKKNIDLISEQFNKTFS